MPLADAGPMSLDARRRRTAGLMAAQFDRPVSQDTFAQPMAPGTEVVERGGLVPLGTYSDGRTGLAWPGFITEPVQSFNRLMSQGYTSGDPQGAEDAFNVAGAAMLGGVAAPRPAARAVSSVPPPKPVSGWHGSGSELLDGFSSRFAGTGHGQASFGPGVYITGSKDLGEGYAKLAAHGGKPGYLHRVETGIDEARMLDFDAPMSQQSEHVLNALSSGANDALGIPRWTWGSMDKTAGHYITGRMRSGDDYALSKGLQNSGIPGIKYANRNAVNPGENLSNYVILDHSAPRVAETTRLYSGGGRPGAAVGAGLSAAGERQGIRAYHGSPHDFDRFDMSKIGTGEGAQAYGHGLYFAEAEEVAQHYRNALSKGGFDVKQIADPYLSYTDEEAIRKLGYAIKRAELNGQKGIAADYKAAQDWFKAGRPDQFSAGRLYEVRINASPDDFLDWDKPLSQQSEKVRDGVRQAVIDRGLPKAVADRLASGDDIPARNAIATLARGEYNLGLNVPDGERAAQASVRLREAGIPGIKYLDQGSRSQGEGSRNYVVFDDNLVEILRKYGMLGMAGGAAAAQGLGIMPQAAPFGALPDYRDVI